MTRSCKRPPTGTPPPGGEAGGLSLLSALARPVLVVVLLLVLIVLAVPGSGVRAMASWWPALTLSIRRLNWMWPGFDMFHALLFFVTGLLAALAFPNAGVRRLLLTLFVLAALTEYIQIWIPGRTSSLLELAIDFGGATAGVLFARLLMHGIGYALDRKKP